ncbi:MAG: HAMP domain-containing histidine kinase [Actinomycetia bacterium]|nr:HAMP domain-containing histidine kinase [Actinomycetes bacterium]
MLATVSSSPALRPPVARALGPNLKPRSSEVPRWAQSIRFRLALAYALAVFAAGTVLLAALYMWQVRQLDEPILVNTRTVSITHPRTAELVDFRYFTQDDLAQAYLEQFERAAYRESLDQLRRASLSGLGILVVVAFGTGWMLAGWTLRPMGRMVAVARDITGTELSRRIDLQGPDDELKDLADTFDAMLDRLQASFEDQRRFVQDTSHELRNPLAVTQTNLELVLDDPNAQPEELREAARIAHASAGRVAKIVDELVDQARQGLPMGQTALVDLGWLANDVCVEFGASAKARGLRLIVDEEAVGAVDVRGDEAALRRAITNLVVNAIRLAPAGTTITIKVDIGDDGLARVAVIDAGPGIDDEEQEWIFERFRRGTAGGNGLGLGLSIVRQVVERHGGRVEVESELGVGSTFTMLLPIPIRR